MPIVKAEICSASTFAQVWAAVLNIEDFPRYMDSVQSVHVVAEEPGGRRTSEWSVLLKGAVLQWTELEEIDEENGQVHFSQLDGDLAHFDGHWHVSPVAGSPDVVVELTVDFDIGIPLLADMLNPVAERALRENAEQMLRGIDVKALG